MNCPRCNGRLNSITYEGVEIETCAKCGGEWLEEGELVKVNRLWEKRFDPALIEELKTLTESTFKIEDETSQLDCPNCESKPMNRSNLAATSGVAY